MQTKNKLREIINYYGVNNQQRKLQEEVFELQEAITIHELKQSVEYEIPLTELVDTREQIVEEMSDIYVILYQFAEIYDITNEEIKKIMTQKINRQIDRIEKEIEEENE